LMCRKSVPEHDNSTSSGCTPMPKMSNFIFFALEKTNSVGEKSSFGRTLFYNADDCVDYFVGLLNAKVALQFIKFNYG
jgi:hypothetical protein